MTADTDDQALIRRMRELSPGDFANLKVALHNLREFQPGPPRAGGFGKKVCDEVPTVNLGTGAGSPNDRLYSAMVERGWMVPCPTEGMPPEANVRMYTILPSARDSIAGLVAKFEAEKGFFDKVPAIMREVCHPFMTQLLARVREDGSDYSGMTLVFGLMLGELVEVIAQDGQGAGVIDSIAANAKSQLSRRPV